MLQRDNDPTKYMALNLSHITSELTLRTCLEGAPAFREWVCLDTRNCKEPKNNLHLKQWIFLSLFLSHLKLPSSQTFFKHELLLFIFFQHYKICMA